MRSVGHSKQALAKRSAELVLRLMAAFWIVGACNSILDCQTAGFPLINRIRPSIYVCVAEYGALIHLHLSPIIDLSVYLSGSGVTYSSIHLKVDVCRDYRDSIYSVVHII